MKRKVKLTDDKPKPIGTTSVGTIAVLSDKLVTLDGFIKNERGVQNIKYSGDGVEGVCMKSYWLKYAKKPRDRQAGSVAVS